MHEHDQSDEEHCSDRESDAHRDRIVGDLGPFQIHRTREVLIGRVERLGVLAVVVHGKIISRDSGNQPDVLASFEHIHLEDHVIGLCGDPHCFQPFTSLEHGVFEVHDALAEGDRPDTGILEHVRGDGVQSVRHIVVHDVGSGEYGTVHIGDALRKFRYVPGPCEGVCDHRILGIQDTILREVDTVPILYKESLHVVAVGQCVFYDVCHCPGNGVFGHVLGSGEEEQIGDIAAIEYAVDTSVRTVIGVYVDLLETGVLLVVDVDALHRCGDVQHLQVSRILHGTVVDEFHAFRYAVLLFLQSCGVVYEHLPILGEQHSVDDLVVTVVRVHDYRFEVGTIVDGIIR